MHNTPLVLLTRCQDAAPQLRSSFSLNPPPTMTKRYFALFLILLALPVLAYGQGVTTSSMRGTVTDTGGAPLPGANVLAVHLPTGSEYGVATNAQGAFNIRNMRVGGPYRVRVTFIGFEPFERDNINLSLGDVEVLNIELDESAAELAGVEVTADAFGDERNGVGTNVGEERIATLPTIGRDLADFTRLTPQAYVENDDDDGPAISIAGQNNRYNSIYVDGTVNNDVFGLSAQGTNGGQTGSTPISIDAIEQFQINLSPFDVTQSGFTGGSINVVTRSGTNLFSGSAYALLRNEGFVGKTPDPLVEFRQKSNPNAEAESLPDFTSNRYGIRLGGPIIQNKLFFFVNGEIFRSATPQPFGNAYSGDATLDDLDALRQGLTDVLGYDPGDFRDKDATLDDDKLLVKLDWNINQDHKLSARYNYSAADNIDAFQSTSRSINFSNNSEVFPNETNSLAVELNSVFGNNYANKLIFGYTTVDDDRGFAGNAFPNVEINDGSGSIFLGSEAFSTANILTQDILTVTNNFNWFRGNHSFTFGAHFESYDIANLFIPQNFGAYEYDSLDDFIQAICAAGQAYSNPQCQDLQRRRDLPDNFAPAAPSVFQRGFSLVDGVAGDGTNAIGAFKAFQIGFYAQDEFQYSESLRFTLGVRVDIPKVSTDPNFAPDVFDTTIPAVSAKYDLNGAEPGSTPAAAPYFAPRFGFNYDVNADRTLQVRGGVGIFT
ncbi:MAG: TonB-dependent receptor, partial [Acidiferrobacterales bacterium]|nr:TonB-dependent receptor [Acidiferrobacterales bacterium]